MYTCTKRSSVIKIADFDLSMLIDDSLPLIETLKFLEINRF